MTARIAIVGEQQIAHALATLLGPQLCVVGLSAAEAATQLRDHATDMLIFVIAPDSGDGSHDMARLAQLRDLAQHGAVPVLALVPRDRPDLLVEAFDLGVADCAGLPFDAHEIRARAAALLRRKHSSDRQSAIAREAERLAMTDAVTGLFNRHHFDAILETAVTRARARTTPLSVLMVDIDLFKPVNDRFGHIAGDRALKAVAHQLSANVRASDVIVRYGGDELLVLMPDTDLATAQRIAERLRVAVGETRIEGDSGDVTLLLTVSVGVAALNACDRDGEALIMRADRALYAAKRGGRNRVETSVAA